MRSEIYSAIKDKSADILDVTVPPASVGLIMDRCDEIAKRYNTTIPFYGHAGDGNFHPHLMDDLRDRGIVREVKRVVYKEAIKLGVVRVPELDLCPDGKTWELVRGIKSVFDPNNILNPGIGLL